MAKDGLHALARKMTSSSSPRTTASAWSRWLGVGSTRPPRRPRSQRRPEGRLLRRDSQRPGGQERAEAPYGRSTDCGAPQLLSAAFWRSATSPTT